MFFVILSPFFWLRKKNVFGNSVFVRDECITVFLRTFFRDFITIFLVASVFCCEECNVTVFWDVCFLQISLSEAEHVFVFETSSPSDLLITRLEVTFHPLTSHYWKNLESNFCLVTFIHGVVSSARPSPLEESHNGRSSDFWVGIPPMWVNNRIKPWKTRSI